jgi:hypothetical protein
MNSHKRRAPVTLRSQSEVHDDAVSGQAKAAYNHAVANYRQTVLTGFQQVEDNLAVLRILQRKGEVEYSSESHQGSTRYFHDSL